MNINYDQIIVQQNVIPYNDLKASGSFDRNLIVPDDIFPTLALPTVNQNGTPRWVQMDKDNGVLVHVTNPSSSGGGVGYAQMAQDSMSTWAGPFIGGANRGLFSMNYRPTYVFGFSWSIFFTTLGAIAGEPPFFQFYIADFSNNAVMTLGGGFADVGGAGSAASRSVYEGQVMFSPPIDMSYVAPGLTQTRVNMDCWAGSGQVGASFWHTLQI